MTDRREREAARAGSAGRVFGALLAAAVVLGLATAAIAGESPYKGLSLKFLTVSNVHQKAQGAELARIAREWGMNLDVRYVTTDQLEKKVVLDYVGGADTWDLVYTGGVQRMYEWHGRGILDELTPFIRKQGDPKLLEWEGFSESARKAVTFGDKVLGLTVATSDQALAYRKDLFSNPEEKAAFRARYGYELRPPDTYTQYRDIAQFFTRRKGEKLMGKVLEQDFYGISNSNKKGTHLWHDYENQALAFGVVIYDPKTRKPGLLSRASIEAATYYQSLLPFWPPNHINMSSGESTDTFAVGRVAMIIEYFDRVVGTITKGESTLKPEQVGYAFPPTQEGNPLGRKHAFRAGPAVVGIFGRSRHKEAAYKLLEASVSAESQLQMAREHEGYMPTKVAALKQLAKEEPAVEYLLTVASSDISAYSDAEVMPYPSILKSSEIGDAISTAISAILTGGKVEEELGKAQAKLEKAFAELK